MAQSMGRWLIIRKVMLSLGSAAFAPAIKVWLIIKVSLSLVEMLHSWLYLTSFTPLRQQHSCKKFCGAKFDFYPMNGYDVSLLLSFFGIP